MRSLTSSFTGCFDTFAAYFSIWSNATESPRKLHGGVSPC